MNAIEVSSVLWLLEKLMQFQGMMSRSWKGRVGGHCTQFHSEHIWNAERSSECPILRKVGSKWRMPTGERSTWYWKSRKPVGTFSLEKKNLSGRHLVVMWQIDSICFVWPRKVKSRTHGWKLQEDRLCLKMRENFLTIIAVQKWTYHSSEVFLPNFD